MKIIELIVSPEGQTKVETRGFTGPSCRQASAFLEQALGTKAKERLTSDFYQSETVRTNSQEGPA